MPECDQICEENPVKILLTSQQEVDDLYLLSRFLPIYSTYPAMRKFYDGLRPIASCNNGGPDDFSEKLDEFKRRMREWAS